MFSVSLSDKDIKKIESKPERNGTCFIARLIDLPEEKSYIDDLRQRLGAQEIKGLKTKELTGSLRDSDDKNLTSDITLLKISYPLKSEKDVFKAISDFGEPGATTPKLAKSAVSSSDSKSKK